MSHSLAHSVDALGDWRHGLESRVRELGRYLREHELLDEPAADLLEAISFPAGTMASVCGI
jgi:hypothetical protein